MVDPKQIESELKKPLRESAVQTRSQAGQTLSYISADHAKREANRIFGHLGWGYEVVYCAPVGPPAPFESRNGKELLQVGYIAKVRVWTGGVVREDFGFGNGMGPSNKPDECHEGAVKEAVSDALKRALVSFGDPFGLALYDKAQKRVDRSVPADAPVLERIEACETRDELSALFKELDVEGRRRLKAHFDAKKEALR